MSKIAILTATYNHQNELPILYKSLLGQKSKDFTWCIVDDGSTDETECVVNDFLSNGNVEIKYYKQKNGGKSSAINNGMNQLRDYDFVVLIDDDECLYPNAIDIINEYEVKYRETKVGVINFNRADTTGDVIEIKSKSSDEKMSVQRRKKLGYNEDGYVGYYMEKLNHTRFPIFEGEKYIGPSVLMMLLGREFDILYAKSTTILGETEYLEDGITKQGRKLRVKNPKGMYVYCLLRQHHDSGLFLRLAYSIYGYAYLYYNNLSEKEIRKELNKSFPEKLIPLAKPLGYILSSYWKIKYKNNA